MHKITNNSIINWGCNLILNKSGRGQPKKHPHQKCNKSVHRFKVTDSYFYQTSTALYKSENSPTTADDR